MANLRPEKLMRKALDVEGTPRVHCFYSSSAAQGKEKAAIRGALWLPT
jgi:hypothetical protein